MKRRLDNRLDTDAGAPQVAFVCWRGAIGGTETHSHLLARELRAVGVDASILFIEGGGPLTARLECDLVPWNALGLARGRAVFRHPHRFLSTLNTVAPDGLILPDLGLLGAALRLLGYRGTVVAVDHGSLLQLSSLSVWKRMRLRVARAAARSPGYEHVVVSQAMRDEVQRRAGASPCTLIHNGVELPHSATPPEYRPSEPLILGITGRLADGKGIECAIHAIVTRHARLRIAGDGPSRVRLESLAGELGVNTQVEFLGWVDDIAGFWRQCHVALVPSTHRESFGLAAVEAMAAARPVIASSQPALAEVIGTSGLLVPPGSSSAIAEEIDRLIGRPELLEQLGLAARERAEDMFDIRRCARAYAELLDIQTRPQPQGPGRRDSSYAEPAQKPRRATPEHA
jgi:glycosyltransferase involved in cell wall biosynthesis